MEQPVISNLCMTHLKLYKNMHGACDVADTTANRRQPETGIYACVSSVHFKTLKRAGETELKYGCHQ